jgi:hypothetical protein
MKMKIQNHTIQEVIKGLQEGKQIDQDDPQSRRRLIEIIARGMVFRDMAESVRVAVAVAERETEKFRA